MTIYAALTINFKGVDEEVVKDARRDAIEGIGGYVVDATLSGMIIEGDVVTLTMAEATITDAFNAIGCELRSSAIWRVSPASWCAAQHVRQRVCAAPLIVAPLQRDRYGGVVHPTVRPRPWASRSRRRYRCGRIS